MKRLAMKKNRTSAGNISQSIFKTFLLSLMIVAQVHFAFAQTTTQGSLIPNGQTVFLDNNGKPLSSGKVYFYTQGTTTPKTTYKDINQTVPNTNPVVLDAAGRPASGSGLWGIGVYRQVVKDKNDNLIWDVVTSTGNGPTGATATGDGQAVGSIKMWPGAIPPSQYAFTYGQTLNRVTYAPLLQALTVQQSVNCTSTSPVISGISNTDSFWIGMTVELSCVPGGVSTIISKTAFTVTLAANANVNTSAAATFFMWGNGNGTTTFNLPDYRGLIPMGNNIMGGIASSNMSDSNFGSQSASSAGGKGGTQSSSTTLLAGNLPSFSIPLTTINTKGISSVAGADNFLVPPSSGGSLYANSVNYTGTSTPFTTITIPPSKTVNFVIKVTPDTAFSGTGVTSLGGMTGDIVCGSGLTCSGGTITASFALSLNPYSMAANNTNSAQVPNSVSMPVIYPATPVTLTTLQAAITDACSLVNSIVQIPTGTWSINTTSSAIIIPSGCGAIIIQGSGGSTSASPGGTVLSNSAGPANDLFSVVSSGSVVIRDLAIAGGTKNAGTAVIRLNNTGTGLASQIIERVTINGGCAAVEVDNTLQYIIRDNLFTSFTCNGIVLTQPTIADQGGNIVEGNKIWDVSGTAGADSCILWNRGSGVRITNNRCLGAFNYGLHVKFDNTFGNDGALIATGNTFEVQKLSGIYLERTAGALAAATTIGQMVFSNNFIQSITPGSTGSINIATSGASPWVISCTISGNTIQSSITPAFNGIIEIDGASDCNGSGNTIDAAGGTGGIRVSGASTNINITSNINPNTTAATRYPALTSTTTIIDTAGTTVANLPSTVANGSIMYATDGKSTNPITGGGSGALALRINGAWVGDLGAAALVAPTQTRLASGTNATYTTPANAKLLKETCYGGGGGGGGSAGSTTAGGTGGTGGNTCLGTNATACTTPLLQANGGVGGAGGGAGGSLANPAAGGSGGSAVAGDDGFAGAPGGSSFATPAANGNVGANGGGVEGGGGAGGSAAAGAVGTKPGGGGGGGGSQGGGLSGGAGGGSGAKAWKLIASPAASYFYTIGAAGTAGTAGTGGTVGFAGGAGGAGYCLIDEFY